MAFTASAPIPSPSPIPGPISTSTSSSTPMSTKPALPKYRESTFTYVPVKPPPPPPPPPPTFSPQELLLNADKFKNIATVGKYSGYLTNGRFKLIDLETDKPAAFKEQHFRDMVKYWSGDQFVMTFMTKQDYKTLEAIKKNAMAERVIHHTERWKMARSEAKREALWRRHNPTTPLPPKRVKKEHRPFALDAIYFYQRGRSRQVFAYLQKDGTVIIKGSSGDEYTREFAHDLVDFLNEKYDKRDEDGQPIDTLVMKEYAIINMCGVFRPHDSHALTIKYDWLAAKMRKMSMFSWVDYEKEIKPAIHLTIEVGDDTVTVMLYATSGKFLVMGAKSADASVAVANTIVTVLKKLKVEYDEEVKATESKAEAVGEKAPVRESIIDEMLRAAIASVPVALPEPVPLPAAVPVPAAPPAPAPAPLAPLPAMESLGLPVFTEEESKHFGTGYTPFAPDVAEKEMNIQQTEEFSDVPGDLLQALGYLNLGPVVEPFHFEPAHELL